MNSYKVRITAGGISKWLGEETNPFVENQADALTFSDRLGDFQKYVLAEAEHDIFHKGRTYNQIGLEKIEFVFS